jgi:hypothetical protein
MNGIRQWRKTGAALGLFAFVLQFWLSFAHVHAESVAPAQIETTALSTPGDDDATLHRDLCAICVTAQLLSSSLVPSAPILIHLPATAAVDPKPLMERTAPGPTPRRFHARAPPLA